MKNINILNIFWIQRLNEYVFVFFKYLNDIKLSGAWRKKKYKIAGIYKWFPFINRVFTILKFSLITKYVFGLFISFKSVKLFFFIQLDAILFTGSLKNFLGYMWIMNMISFLMWVSLVCTSFLLYDFESLFTMKYESWVTKLITFMNQQAV